MKYIIVIGLYLVVFVSNAQETVFISKEAALEKVKEQNLAVKIGAQQVLSAKGDYDQSRAVFLPNITASHSGMLTTNPLMAFGFKLNQARITQEDFNPNNLNNPSQTRLFATKFEIQQPILNLDGLYERKAAKATWRTNQMQVTRTSDQIALETERAYLELQLAYEQVASIEQSLTLARENERLANNRYKQGYLQQADILMVQVRVREVENQLQFAKSAIMNASDYLATLMNEPVDGVFKPSDSLTFNMEILPLDGVLTNRADVVAMELATEAYEQSYKADKMSFLPRLNAFGSYELYDDQIFQADASGYLLGAALQWDLFQGYKRFGKLHKSKAQFNKSMWELEKYKSESQLEINKTKRLVEDAKNNIRLAEMGLEQSKEVFRIRKNRFEEGLEKSSDLLLAETLFAQKQLAYYDAVFNYNYALAYLKFLTKN